MCELPKIGLKNKTKHTTISNFTDVSVTARPTCELDQNEA